MTRGLAMAASYKKLVFTFLAMCCASSANAGFWALPIEAELDLAKRVVLGEITKIEQTNTKYDKTYGKATVLVEKTLKGAHKDMIEMVVVVQSNNVGRQSPTPIYKVGHKDIWLIMANGKPSHGYGLLKRNRLKEIEGYLVKLNQRQWSDAVGGIQVWVGAANPHTRYAQHRAIIFAVNNVGKETVYLPLSRYSGIVTVVAQHEDGKQHELRGAGDQSEVREGKEMICDPLEPGGTRYMHWDGENYGAFIFPKDAVPGAYTIRAVLNNDRTLGETRGRDRKSIQSWIGKVTSNPVIVVVKETSPEPSPGDEPMAAPQE